MSKELEINLKEIASGIAAMQENHTKDAEKYDGINKNIQVELAAVQEKHSALEVKQKAIEDKNKFYEEEIKRLEAIACRPGGGKLKPSQKHAEYKKEFRKYLRTREAIPTEISTNYIKSIIEDAYQGSESKSLDIHVKTLQTGVNPDGGFLIVPQRGKIIDGRIFETSPVRDVANVMTITSNEIDFPLDDNEIVSGGWVAELGTRNESANAQFGFIKILAHEQYAWQGASQTMLDDYPDIDTWLINKINDKFTRVENTAFVSGDGADKPKGFLAYSAWTTPSTIAGVTGTYQRNAIEQIVSGSSGQVTGNGIITTQGALKQDYQANATWLMKRMTFNSGVCLAVDGVGRYLINPNLLYDGRELTLLGKRVIFADDMQAIGAGALAIAYGDFKRGYTIVDRLGIRILRDPFSSTPKVLFKASKRCGGGVTNFEAIKLNVLS